MTVRHHRLARPVALLVAAGTAAVLAGCSPAGTLLGVRSNTAVLSGRPAITTEQAAAVARRALAETVRADALRTEAAAKSAFIGLALRTAPPRYAVEKALDAKSVDPADALAGGVDPKRVVVTAGRSFPRTVLAVWTPPGASRPQVAVLDSDDVRSPFRVSARADLLPGAALPATAPNSTGASLLPADVQGLVATPKAAVADLARLLQTGRSTNRFAAGDVVKDVRAKAAAQAKSVANVARFSQTHRADADGMRVFRTADGGAVVVAAIDRVDRVVLRKGAGVVQTPPGYRALAKGLKKITKRADMTTVQMVVLQVPRAGGGDIRLLGFAEDLVSVSGS